jgi:membrane fusion protein (multidrug efflux system)
MNSARRIIEVTVIALAGLMISSCRKAETSNNQKIQPVDVKTELVVPQTLVDAIQVSGVAKAWEDANISPEEGGVVKEWKAAKGQHVRKGDVIILFKDEMLKAGFEAADAQYKMAELSLQKQRSVYEEKGISDLQFKNLQYGRDAAKANADLMNARWERTRIRSPFDGEVDNIIPNVGEFAPPGMPVARVVNLETIKIQAEVPELYSGTLSLGIPAVITFDALPGDTLEGKVSFVSSAVSATNRTMQVEVVLSNPFRKLKPEMIAKVRLLREIKHNAILVSANIVQLVDRDRIIVYVENNGRAEERRLKLGGRQGLLMEVLDGLKLGDHLVVTGYEKLVNGTAVKVVNEAERQ